MVENLLSSDALSTCHLSASGADALVELEEVSMPIVGGLDIHRKQITFDYVDTVTGELERGRICPADRRHLADWLRRWPAADRVDVDLALEGCTGGAQCTTMSMSPGSYVVEELARAGVQPHLAEPADTAGLRGRRRHAKTDRADAQHLRQLLGDGRLPECWIPPGHVIEARALLETYRDVRVEHTGWVQRIHAVLFHQGARQLVGDLGSAEGRLDLAVIAATQLSPAGQRQIKVAMDMLTATETQLTGLRHDLVTAARHLHGARVLTDRLYGVGPITGLALTWLARRRRSVLLGAAGGPVRWAGCHRLLLRRQTLTGAAVTAGPAGVALVLV